MTAIERINQLSHRIFNTSMTERNVARSSNPFAASNFQQNILTEDVFESSKHDNKVSFTGNLSAASKRIYSTFVGSITDFGHKFYEGLDAIKEFGVKMKDCMVSAWNKINEIGKTEVTIDLDGARDVLSRDITSFFGNTHAKEINKLSKMDPHTEVKPMLTEALSALEVDMILAA